MDLFIIDGNASFFLHAPQRRINWSKIPFEHLEEDGYPAPGFRTDIEDAFRTFTRRASEAGYTHITLDDVANLADAEEYPPAVRERIASYRGWYRRLFALAREAGLAVLLNTDVMFEHRLAPHLAGKNARQVSHFLGRLLERLLDDFPEVAGVVFRIGESDGLDVQGAFHSRLVIRTPRQARHLLRHLLPVFEQRKRLFIFRTWSVGAYRVGDLGWNRDTFEAVFRNIDSPALVISMKYGESDFFRYLPLNPLFFRSNHAKIIELQARREYEGSGEYPSFTGFDYERYRRQLADARNVRGIMVWCQTGGWSVFRRLTYLPGSSIWNEINTWTTLRIFKEGLTTQEAVEDWCRQHDRARHTREVLELLALSDEVVKSLLYVDAFAERKIFFRRLRVPTLLSVFWDQVIVNHAMRKILRCFVRDGDRQLEIARTALAKIERMRHCAASARLPERDLEFMYDTFALLAAARSYYFQPYTPELVERLKQQAARYRETWPVRYSFHLDFDRVRIRRTLLGLAFRLVLRHKRGYRIIDRLFTLRVLGWIYPILRKRTRLIPEFAHQQAMGLDTVFK